MGWLVWSLAHRDQAYELFREVRPLAPRMTAEQVIRQGGHEVGLVTRSRECGLRNPRRSLPRHDLLLSYLTCATLLLYY